MLLTEYFPITLNAEQLNEAAAHKGGPMTIKNVLLQKADAFNRNKRRYPKPILEREVNRFNDDLVKSNRALGELDHSSKNLVELKNVSHLIKEIWWNGDDVLGNIEILDSAEFPAGMILAGLLRRQIPVGISSRGMGSVETLDEDGHVEVQEDFALLTWDCVSFESTIGSNFSLNEARSVIEANKFDHLDNIIHDLICANSNACECKILKK